MSVRVVLVHGIRTSATMWRAQRAHLAARGVPAVAVDLPGHGSRMAEPFTLDGAWATIDAAVRDAAAEGEVLLVGHSMGGLLCLAYAGRLQPPPVAALIAAGATAVPRGAGLAAYRAIAAGFNALPGHGRWLSDRVLAATLPPQTRDDFAAGGYAFAAQDDALASLATVDVVAALGRIRIPAWFVNGQFDQMRVDERLFTRLVPHAEHIVVPRATHLVTAMYPRVFNAVIDLAIATVAHR